MSQKATIIQSAIQRNDGLENFVTGLGQRGRDKRVSVKANAVRLTHWEAENLFAASPEARKIVTKVVKDATRKWIQFSAINNAHKIAVSEYFKKLRVKKYFSNAWTTARVYGGAAVYVHLDDGLNSDQPVIESKIRGIKSLVVLNRYELVANVSDIESRLESPLFNLPRTYTIYGRNGNFTGVNVHASRLIRFDGSELPMNLFILNNYWHDSVMSGLWNAIINFSQAHDSMATMIMEFYQRILKIKGLAEMIGSGGEDTIKRRMELQDLIRSTLKTDVIDAEDELTLLQTSFQNIDKVIEKINVRLAGAANMPHTVLFGEAPSGLGATGKSEDDDWTDYVSAEQSEVLEPAISRLLELVLAAQDGPTNGHFSKDISFHFYPLKEMDEKEKADVRKSVAETDKIYVEMQVAMPEEIAMARFGGQEYSMETRINCERLKPIIENDPESDDEDEVEE